MKQKGIVKWYDKNKRFGFIQPEGNDTKDIFVHESNVETLDQNLEKGEIVEFEIGKGPRGPEAKSVKPVDETV